MTSGRTGSAGKPRLLTAALLFTGMAAAAFHTPAADQPECGGLRISHLPLADMTPAVSLALGWGVVLATAALLIFLNKQYIFLKSNDTLYSSLFLLACGAQPALSARLGEGSLLLAVSAGCLWLLLSQRGRSSSPASVFLLFATLSAGAAVCASFMVLAVLFIPCAYVFGLLGWRGILAMLMGLATPWWIMFAAGWPDPASAGLPDMLCPIWRMNPGRPLFFSLLCYGITFLAGALCALGGLMRIYSQNAGLRASSWSFIILGAGAAAMILLSPATSSAWGGLLNLCTAVLLAQQVSFANGRGTGILFWAAAAVYLTIFIISIYG